MIRNASCPLNAVEIEQAVSELAGQEFDPVGFPYAFLVAFGNKPTTIKRLKSGSSNISDIENGVLHNNMHIAVCEAGKVTETETLARLKESPATKRGSAQFT